MTLRYALLLDTETTGFREEGGECIEVAIVVYDILHCAPLLSFASLINATSNAAEAINGIPVAMLQEAPMPELVWNRVFEIAKHCDVIVAHRAEFDRDFVAPEVRDIKPWICSKFDIEWPKTKVIGESLVSLALQHGVGVTAAHRALTDCDILARLFTRVAELGVDLEAMLERGLRPKNLFYSLAPFEKKDIVKAHGFAWDPSRHGKNWYRYMPVSDTEALPFRVRQVD